MNWAPGQSASSTAVRSSADCGEPRSSPVTGRTRSGAEKSRRVQQYGSSRRRNLSASAKDGPRFGAAWGHDAGMSDGNDEGQGQLSLHSPAEYLSLARDPTVSEDEQRMLLAKDLSFVTEALAANPATSEQSLIEILSKAPASDWSYNRILRLVAGHRSASPRVLLVVRDGIVRQLQAAARPYAAGRVLAERSEIAVDEVAVLLSVPGGSKRFRRALQAALQRRMQPGADLRVEPQV